MTYYFDNTARVFFDRRSHNPSAAIGLIGCFESANGLATRVAQAFIHRFLQHVLPKGFVKVRYYGLLVPRYRKRLTQANPLYASRLSGYFLSVTGGNCMGLHLTSLLSRPTLNTMRVLGWLSRAARNHGNKTEIP